MKAIQRHLNVNIPLVSPMLAVEYFFICSPHGSKLPTLLSEKSYCHLEPVQLDPLTSLRRSHPLIALLRQPMPLRAAYPGTDRSLRLPAGLGLVLQP
jgi:hypothetical protein